MLSAVVLPMTIRHLFMSIRLVVVLDVQILK
jgi:hypothetical protein